MVIDRKLRRIRRISIIARCVDCLHSVFYRRHIFVKRSNYGFPVDERRSERLPTFTRVFLYDVFVGICNGVPHQLIIAPVGRSGRVIVRTEFQVCRSVKLNPRRSLLDCKRHSHAFAEDILRPVNVAFIIPALSVLHDNSFSGGYVLEHRLTVPRRRIKKEQRTSIERFLRICRVYERRRFDVEFFAQHSRCARVRFRDNLYRVRICISIAVLDCIAASSSCRVCMNREVYFRHFIVVRYCREFVYIRLCKRRRRAFRN